MSSTAAYNKLKRTSEDLIEEDLDVINSQRLLRHYDTMKVALHQFRGNVAVICCQGRVKSFTSTVQQNC